MPVLAAVAVYWPALRNGFIWDDPIVLQQLRAIHSFADLFVLPAIVPRFYFRPVIFLSYLCDRTLGGETPFWFHASVVGFHALNTLLVFVLARRLFPADWLVASGGALLFAVLPMHVESVAWMAGRSDVIVCTFVLLTVLLCMDRERVWSCWLGGATFLLAALSKEMALACLALVPLLDLLRTQRLEWARYVPLVIAAAVYSALRINALGGFVGGVGSGRPPGLLGLDLLRAAGFYFVRAVVPVALCPYIPEVPASSAYLLIGVSGLAVSLLLIGVAWRRGRWELAFLGAWFLLTLAPSLSVIVRHSASAVLADRYLYVPTVASCPLLAWSLARMAQRLRITWHWPAGAIAGLSVLLAVQAASYTRVWADNLAFWSDVVTKVPEDALPHRELAIALLDRGRVGEAEQALQRALAGRSDREGRAMTFSNLGNLYRRQGRYDEAQKAFAAALQIGPHPALFHNLGMTLMARVEQEQRQGKQAAVARDLTTAREAFEQALQVGSAPDAPPAFRQQWDPAKTHALLGQVLFSMGDRAGAREHLETSLQLESNGPVANATRQYMRKFQE